MAVKVTLVRYRHPHDESPQTDTSVIEDSRLRLYKLDNTTVMAIGSDLPESGPGAEWTLDTVVRNNMPLPQIEISPVMGSLLTRRSWQAERESSSRAYGRWQFYQQGDDLHARRGGEGVDTLSLVRGPVRIHAHNLSSRSGF